MPTRWRSICLVLLAVITYSKALEVTYCSPTLVASSQANSSIYMSNGFCDCWCSNYAPGTTVNSALCGDPCPGYPPDPCGNVTASLYAYFNLNRRAVGTASALTAVVFSAAIPTISRSELASSATPSNTLATPTITSSSQGRNSSSSSFIDTGTSAILLYIQTALPASARSESSNACFVNSAYTYYSTPTWYSLWPTQVQSYYSSSNQGSTAACTLSPSQIAATSAAASPHSSSGGLSKGAKAGIAIGVILGVLLIVLLAFFCIRRRKRRSHTQAMQSEKASYDHNGIGTTAAPELTYEPEPNSGSIGAYLASYPTPVHSERTGPAYPVNHTPSAHHTYPPVAAMGAMPSRHNQESNNMQNTPPSVSELNPVRGASTPPPSHVRNDAPWAAYPRQANVSRMSEEFFPALQEQNPYQLGPEMEVNASSPQHTIPRKPVQTNNYYGQVIENEGVPMYGTHAPSQESWYHAR